MTPNQRNNESPIARAKRLLLGEKDTSDSPPQVNVAVNVSTPESSESPAAPNGNGKTNGHYAMGDILLLDGGGVVVYRQPVPGKPYDFTYQLVPDGRFEARAVPVASHGPRPLGQVDSDLLRRLIRDKQWERDEMTACLSDDSLAGLLPRDGDIVGASNAGAASAATPGKEMGLNRGDRVVIKNGRHAWEAVYWGAGEDGEDVLAHKAGDAWNLTNMDLSQYGDNLEVKPAVSQEAISEILECVMASR